jgi:hypothetical protein
MPSLLDRIRAIFRQAEPIKQQPTTATETKPPSRPTELMSRFKSETGRAAVVRKCREMYANDPRARKMIRTLARDLTKGGFVVKVEDDDRAVEIAQELENRLDLEQKIDDWVRLSARDGDSFLEIGVDDNLEIAEVTRKPALQMHRNTDEFDRFTDPERAFWWTDELWTGQDPPNDATWFAQWQIIHARWEHDEGSRYGTPMLSSGTGHWKKVVEGELDIAVRRKTRAGMKYVHKFPEDVSQATVEAYKEINQDALDNPFAAVADFFGKVDVSAIQGDARLAEIGDVEHMIATWFMSGEVPMELIGYGENLNRDVLEQKQEEYREIVDGLRSWVEAELLKPLFERQWLLQGIYPPNLNYSFEWKAKQIVTPLDLVNIADAAFKFEMLGINDSILWSIFARYLPGVDTETLLSSMTGDGDGPDRIAGVLANISGGL